MDIRSPLNQCIALSLAGILFLNPIVAAAAGLALDKAAGGNTGLGQAGNGVPVVNIATPNGAGLSNNHFRDYNVGANGLILNNATGKTQGTQLGGIILGNPNLKGQAAQVILNQVTGGNRSTLAGYTEVAGQSARVIVANPHGITCQGCGFINTPRATLTTGKPIMDGQRLERFQVDGGDIVVEGAELNVGNLEQFDLITRSAKLNAKLYAKNLNIVTVPQRRPGRQPAGHAARRRWQREAAAGDRQLGAGRDVRRGDPPGRHRAGRGGEAGRRHGRQRRRHPHRRQRQAEPGPGLQPG